MMRAMDFFTMIFGALRFGGLLGAALIVFAAIVMWRGMKDRASLLVLVGGFLAVLGPVGNLAFSLVLARWIPMSSYALVSLVSTGVETAGWLMVGVGFAMLAPTVVGLARRNRELEAIVAERS